MPDNTQNPQAASPQTPEAGSEEAAILALSGGVPDEEQKHTKPDDTQAESDEATGDAPDEEVTPEGDDETEDGDDTGPELVEFEENGKTYKIPKSLHEGNLRQSDYSRNMNALAEEKKQVQAQRERAEIIVSGVQQIAEAQRQATQLQDELTQYENLDWAALQQNNPGQYAKAVAHYTTLPAKIDQALLKAQNVEGEIRQARSAEEATARESMLATLQKDLKGWGEERGQKITAYALSQGYTADDLQKLTDARIVIALDKARRFDAIQSAKGELKDRVKNVPPVAKPGSPRSTHKNDEVRARFNKTRSDEDAIRLLS